jgi:acetolactate synthase-1/3 small subunit
LKKLLENCLVNIEKQVEVLKAYYNTNDEIVWRELALYKVSTDEGAEKVTVERLLREHGARAVVIRKDYTVFETSGHSRTEQTGSCFSTFWFNGICKKCPRVAIIKASHGFHEKLREFEEAMPRETNRKRVSEQARQRIYHVIKKYSSTNLIQN